MQTKFVVLITVVVVVLLGLAGILIWCLKFRDNYPSTFRNPFRVPSEGALEFEGNYELVHERG